ncbi:hypothetical protein JB92DRAFT_3139211 [Gautieria morchelliformis]|nr:hypothetical protein JB92DRAFT_3139211 [Gautieria morchelliformis]
MGEHRQMRSPSVPYIQPSRRVWSTTTLLWLPSLDQPSPTCLITDYKQQLPWKPFSPTSASLTPITARRHHVSTSQKFKVRAMINDTDFSAPSLNREVTDICMGEQDITYAASISPGEFVPQGSSQLPDASLDITPGEYHSAYPQHIVMQVGTLTTTLDLEAYIIKTRVNDTTSYSCGYPDCGQKGRFVSRRKAISHIRCIHLKEKPFKCTTCGTFFARKPDATRHVSTMNRGKIYECTVCHKCYAREDFRDKHEKRCFTKSQGKEQGRA